MKKKACYSAECERPVYSFGLCSMHYQRAVAAGDITPKKRKPYARDAPEFCTIEGCRGKYLSRGYCSKHYWRMKRHGDPLHDVRAAQGDHMAWLAANIGFDGDECLIWPFRARTLQGYGTTNDPRGVQKNASNVMCELAHGEPPTQLHEAAHSCGKGHDGCVNPKHLRWATRSENHADKHIHGTALCGEASPVSKLTEKQVLEIRAHKGQAQEVADKMGISRNYVYQIKAGERWKHIL